MTPVTPLPGLPELPDDLENTQVSVGRQSEPERLVARLGEGGYKIGYSVLSAIGLVCMVVCYAALARRGRR